MPSLPVIFLPVVELVRLEEHSSQGTFGILRINKSLFCVTLESGGKENKENVSSIPAKQYICYKRKSLRFNETFEVMNVPERKDILFHSGNVIEDTTGCVLLAQHFGKLKGRRAILNSGKTFKQFMNIMKEIKFFHLTIKEFY